VGGGGHLYGGRKGARGLISYLFDAYYEKEHSDLKKGHMKWAQFLDILCVILEHCTEDWAESAKAIERGLPVPLGGRSG